MEALEPFAIFNDAQSRDLALAFNLPYVVDSKGSLTGMSSGAAKVPAVIAEAGGNGQYDWESRTLLVEGARNALKHLGVLDGPPEPSRSRVMSRFDWVRTPVAGFWIPGVEAGDEIPKGAPLGAVYDLYGDELALLQADDDGVVLFLTTSAAVAENGLLLGLGCDERSGA